MSTVADQAQTLVQRAQRGPTRVVISRGVAPLFVAALLREGIALARDCLDRIADRELRSVLEAVIFGTAAGALLGASIGAALGGPVAGAVVGAAVGLAGSVLAVAVTFSERRGKLVIETA